MASTKFNYYSCKMVCCGYTCFHKIDILIDAYQICIYVRLLYLISKCCGRAIMLNVAALVLNQIKDGS